MSADEKRDAYIQGLRMLADALERSETIPVPRTGSSPTFALDFGLAHSVTSGGEFAAIIRALGGKGWQQEVKTSGHFTWLKVTGHLDGFWVQVGASADKVCEPIEPQPVPERTCPALDEVIAEAGNGSAS